MSEAFVSEAWVGQLPELARDVRLGDFTGAVDVLVTDAPGKVRVALDVDAGQLTSASIGKAKGAAISIEVKARHAAALIREELDPAVAYMRGDVKLNDAYELVLFDWRSASTSAEWGEFVDALCLATVFDAG